MEMGFSFLDVQGQILQLVDNIYIHILTWMVVLDIGSGLLKSFKTKRSNSTTALFGIVKHVLVLLLVMISSTYLPLLGYATVAQWVIIYLIVAYLISFAENWVMLGLPAPDFVIEKLEKLKDVMDGGNKITIESPKDSSVEITTKEEVK